MPDVENLNDLVGVTVDDYVRRNNKLASAFYLAGSAHAGERRQLLDAVNGRLSGLAGGFGIVLLNVLNEGFEIGQRLRSSTEYASRLAQPIDAGHHVFVVDELATVGLRDAFFHTGNEAGVIFQHVANGVFHQLLGVLAIGKRYLLEPRFNVGREMYFHSLRIGEMPF